MEKLKMVIGLAPSEMNPEELIEKLAAERRRVNELLQAPVPVKKKRATAKRKKKDKTTLTRADIRKIEALLGTKIQL